MGLRHSWAFIPVVVLATTLGLPSSVPTAAAEGKSWLRRAPAPAPAPKKKRPNDGFDYPVIGDNTSIHGMQPVKAEGVGLVVGLPGTGSDPPPNRYREMMLDIMSRHEVEKPEEILSSTTTAIVLLRAYLPPGVRKGDKIDVEAWTPPGDETTSLRGGKLLEAEMFEQLVTRKSATPLKGEQLVAVDGPLLVIENPQNKDDSAALRRGKILGGGKVLYERNFVIVLDREARSGRTTKKFAQEINLRFFDRKDGRPVGLANAKDDKMIELRLPRQYRYNYQRFLLVVRRIPLSSSTTFRSQLAQDLGERLRDPRYALDAALRLEALGMTVAPVLREGLDNESQLVKFASAEALSYLGDPNGAKVLGELARESALYRPYALTALVALDHAAGRMQLSDLLHADGAETRYGAFRSLWAFDARDPLVKAEDLGDEFSLHLVPSTSDPMIHLSRNFRREIVVFNDKQRLLAPMILRAGDRIMVTAGDEAGTAYIATFRPGPDGVVARHAETPLDVVDVIRTAAKMGATYPDIVELLQQARVNGNLMGRLEINALPKALPLETLVAVANDADESDATATAGHATPSLFAETGAAAQGPLPRLVEVANEDSNADKDSEKKPAPKPPFWKRILGSSANN